MHDAINIWAAARDYARNGIYVNPVYVTRDADGKKKVKPVGLWRDRSSISLADIATWEQDHPDAGILIDCGKSGFVVVDCDGQEGCATWRALEPPAPLWIVLTAGGGEHWYYRADPDHPVGNDQSGKVAPSVDIRGLGGFVFAPPTSDGTGQWTGKGAPDWQKEGCTVPRVVIERMKQKNEPAAPAVVSGEVLFDTVGRTFTRQAARDFITKEGEEKLRARALELKRTGRKGFNGAINDFAMVCAHFPKWCNREWTARKMIEVLQPITGWSAPDRQDIDTIESAWSATEKGKSWIATPVTEESASAGTAPAAADGSPRLLITGSADMTYWLADEVGKGRLSGFFLRDARIVHTPRVNEIGYVPAGDDGDNGPAEIRPVSTEEMAAKIQFLYACYKRDKEGLESAALFPVEAARRVVNAPEAAAGLRALRGITLTPMVRANGSILAEPGYDKESGYLFLPGRGVAVPAVSAAPTAEEIAGARTLLEEMVAGFPFVSDDDRANYFGALLTPMLRLMCPPPYKMIGIGAHQPGSGKTLLAQTISIVHGGVMRSEVPEDEAEWRKMTTSLLATTSAPVAVLDNVTGVLRSSVLAGLLTARGEIQDRELGSSRMLRTENDRLWVITGNNLSLGGDLVRRTITVMIDPDMANPETRTGFAIKNLPQWVEGNRNRILHALLTLIQNWVHRGAVGQERSQSDGYADWEKAVAAILTMAGIPGQFDAESGKRAAKGGDDEGVAHVLDVLRDRFGDKSWSVAEALEAQSDHGEFMVEKARDWLPAAVADKIERSPAAGRISFGWWLRNRVGRWVNQDGRNLVIREAGYEKKVARWKIEER